MWKLFRVLLAGVVGLVVLAILFPGEPRQPEELCGLGREMVADGHSRETVERAGICDSRVREEGYEALYRERYGS